MRPACCRGARLRAARMVHVVGTCVCRGRLLRSGDAGQGGEMPVAMAELRRLDLARAVGPFACRYSACGRDRWTCFVLAGIDSTFGFVSERISTVIDECFAILMERTGQLYGLLAPWPIHVNCTPPPPSVAIGASMRRRRSVPIVMVRPAAIPSAAPNATSLR